MLDFDAVEQAVNEQLAAVSTPAEQIQASGEQLTKTLNRIRVMLRLAQNGGATPGERAAAADKAADLQAQYGITAAMLAEDGLIAEEVAAWQVEVGAPYTYDKVQVLSCMVDAYGARCVYTSKSTELSVLKVYAMPSNLVRMKLLWPSLLAQLDIEMRWAGADKPAGIRRDVFDRSFIAGFAVMVAERLRTAEQRAVRQEQQRRDDAGKEGMSVELVLSQRRTQVDAYYQRQHPNARTVRRSITRSPSGLAAGTRAGGRADLGHRRLGD